MEDAFVSTCARCGAEVVAPYRFCSACGQPLAAAPTAPYPRFSPPRKENAALIIVLVVVLVIGLPTILAGVLYYMVPAILAPVPTKPAIILAASNVGSYGATILVESIQPTTAPSYVRLNLQVGGSYGSPVTIPPSGTSTSLYVGSGLYNVGYYNPSGSGELSQGDEFQISFPYGYGAPAPGAIVTFLLLWRDGSTLANLSFMTPNAPPTVLLNVTKLASGADVVVFLMDPLYPPTDFLVNVENITGGVYGNATPMPTTSGTAVYVTVGSGTSQSAFSITWQNAFGNGEVSGGDHFVVARVSGAYATGTAFAFVLVWNDGSNLATASWVV